MTDSIISSIPEIFRMTNILFMFLGVGAGIIFGCLPGLSATMGVALMLPLTFGLDPITGILFLLGVYVGGIYGGSISAILINTPGTPASAATTIDGYYLTKKGKAGDALRMALYASVIAGVISALVLLFLAPQIAKVALKFGPPEYFALALFGLAMISSVSGKSILKGLIMGVIGFSIATIGLDPIGGSARLSFGNENLFGGIQLIPALIGLFAIAEIINRSQTAHSEETQTAKFKDSKFPFSIVMKNLKTIVKSSFIGTAIGAIPGTGATIASYMSYNEAMRSSKKKDEFGKGSIEGVAAAEAGNNGVTGSTLIPLLTLGIPGDTVTAVMLGALMMQGLTPGPQLFTTHADFVYAIMVGLIVVNVIMLINGKLAIKLFVRVTAIPFNVLVPILLTLSFIGAYAVNNTLFDVKVMLVFGLLGFVMGKFGFPSTPLLLGLVLGPIAETSLRQALILSKGSWTIFFTQPISLAFIVIAVISFLIPFIKMFRDTLKERKDKSISHN